jgi:hypothetical protein
MPRAVESIGKLSCWRRYNIQIQKLGAKAGFNAAVLARF